MILRRLDLVGLEDVDLEATAHPRGNSPPGRSVRMVRRRTTDVADGHVQKG